MFGFRCLSSAEHRNVSVTSFKMVTETPPDLTSAFFTGYFNKTGIHTLFIHKPEYINTSSESHSHLTTSLDHLESDYEDE